MTEVFDLHARLASVQLAANSASRLLDLTDTYAGQTCDRPDFVAELLAAILLRRRLLLPTRFVVIFLSAFRLTRTKQPVNEEIVKM